MSESLVAHEEGARKATWIPLEVRDLGGIAAAQGAGGTGVREDLDYVIS